MKYLKGYNSFRSDIEKINELGEANLPPYELTSFNIADASHGMKNYKASFTTDNNDEYVVEIECDFFTEISLKREGFKAQELSPVKNHLGREMYPIHHINFYIKDNVDFFEIVNKGDNYRVMSTITSVIKDIIDLEKGKYISFIFEGTQKNYEYGSQSLRTKLYVRYLQNHLPSNFEFQTSDNKVLFYKNNKHI